MKKLLFLPVGKIYFNAVSKQLKEQLYVKEVD